MLKRLIPLLMVMGMISLAAIACGGDAEPTQTSQRASPSPPPQAPTVPADATETATEENGDVTPPPGTAVTVDLLDLGGGNASYEFSSDEFTFSVGETVTFTLVSQAEFHTFTVDDLEIDVIVNGGDTETLTFTFDQAGTFELICSPHQFLGMVGTITVQ